MPSKKAFPSSPGANNRPIQRAQPHVPATALQAEPAAPALSLDQPNHAQLPHQPPAQLTPTRPNFFQQPSGLADRTVSPWLTVPERVNLARTSKAMLREISAGNSHQESKAILEALHAFKAAQQGSIANRGDLREEEFRSDLVAANKRHDTVRDAIIEARAARGIQQPHLFAFREARRLCDDDSALTSATLLEIEQQLVEASDATSFEYGPSARGLHDSIWKLDALERTEPRDQMEFDMSRSIVHSELAGLLYNLRHALTADLLPASELRSPATPKHTVVFISHYVDEPWTHGKTVDQTHIVGGLPSTQSLPWPNPRAGISRVRFEFAPNMRHGCSYVHTFNLPNPMETAD